MSSVRELQKPLAVFDVDGTIFKSACVEKVTDQAIRQGVFEAVTFEQARVRRRQWQSNNNEGLYQAYLHHLVGAFIASMAGIEIERFRAVTTQMVAEHGVRLFRYPKKLAETLSLSHRLIAVSGSPLPVVEPFLQELGFDQIIGSTFEIQDGHYTGEAQSIDKATVVHGLLASSTHISVGIGDTISDTPVLEQARCSIAFNPSATLRREAIRHGWPIVIEQKDAVTQLLPGSAGYKVVFDRSPSIILAAAGIET